MFDLADFLSRPLLPSPSSAIAAAKPVIISMSNYAHSSNAHLDSRHPVLALRRAPGQRSLQNRGCRSRCRLRFQALNATWPRWIGRNHILRCDRALGVIRCEISPEEGSPRRFGGNMMAWYTSSENQVGFQSGREWGNVPLS